MSFDELLKLAIEHFGLSGALVAAFLIGLYKRKLCWGSELTRSEARCKQELADAKSSHAQVRDDYIARVKQLEASEQQSREDLMEMSRALVKALDVAQAVIHA